MLLTHAHGFMPCCYLCNPVLLKGASILARSQRTDLSSILQNLWLNDTHLDQEQHDTDSDLHSKVGQNYTNK